MLFTANTEGAKIFPLHLLRTKFNHSARAGRLGRSRPYVSNVTSTYCDKDITVTDILRNDQGAIHKGLYIFLPVLYPPSPNV